MNTTCLVFAFLCLATSLNSMAIFFLGLSLLMGDDR